MPGIIRFDRVSRCVRQVSRRTLMLGAARYAGAAALGAMTTSGQGSGTPGATPDKATRPEPGLVRGEARKRLKGLLSLVPLEHVGGPEPGSWLFTWADVQTQLVALGNP